MQTSSLPDAYTLMGHASAHPVLLFLLTSGNSCPPHDRSLCPDSSFHDWTLRFEVSESEGYDHPDSFLRFLFSPLCPVIFTLEFAFLLTFHEPAIEAAVSATHNLVSALIHIILMDKVQMSYKVTPVQSNNRY